MSFKMEPSSEVVTITMTASSSSSCSIPLDEKKSARKVKPYGCVMCKRAFSKALKLQKHMLEAHGITEESDDDEEDDEVVEEEEEEDRDDAGHIERRDEDGINLFADAAASVLGDLSGESRDADDSLSHSHPTEDSRTDRQTDANHCDTEPKVDSAGTDFTTQSYSAATIQAALQLNPSESRDTDDSLSHSHPTDDSQSDRQTDANHRDTEPKVDSAGTDFTTQSYSTATIQAALQLNPSDIIARAAAGANILVDEKDGDVAETQSVHLDTGALIVAEIDGLSHDPDDVRKDDTPLFFDPSPQGRTASSPEDGAIVQTDREESQCSETISQMFPVLLHQAKSSSKNVRPEPRSTEESAETSKATDDSYREDCVGGEVQSKNWQEKKIPKSSRCRQRSCQITSSNNKPSNSEKGTLKGSAQVSGTAKKQAVGIDQRPHLRRSRRSAKRKVDKDFLTESEEGKEKQGKKQKREEKRKDETKRRQKEQKRKAKKTEEEMEITSRELPETSQECEGTGTKKKRRTLKEKLADLQKAHEETEKLNILVQKIISDSSDGKTAEKKSLLTCLKRKSLSRKSKAKMSKTYDCLSCREKFPSLSDCIDHMRKAHLSSKKRCQVESEEPSSSDISSALEEDYDEDDVKDDEEMRKTNQDNGPTKVAKHLQNGKGSGKGGEFSCEYCSEISKSIEGQRAHMSVHCGLVEEKCFKCKIYESRPSAAQIEDIERSVEKVRETTDSDGYEFKQGKRLLVQFFQCIVCNSCFAVEKHLRNHMSQHKVIVCQVCSGVFSSTQALGKHIPHHKTGPLSCKTCGQTFFSSYMLLMHMRGHTKDFRCKHCDAPFMFRGNLLRHIRQRHTDKTDCDPASGDDAASQHERSSKNKGQSKLNCRFCGNLHCSEVTLKRHIETYHPERVDDRGKFVCELCGAVRHKFSQLKAHMICHNQPKQKCQICSKVFLRPASLKQHIQQVHAGRKDYTCQYCGKRISSSTSLQDHERLHTGEKPYVCLECGKSFRIRQSYKTHLQTKHSKEKPFGCPQCGNCFFSCKSLAKHQRIHTPNEDSVCPDCGKQFKRKDLLRMHLVQHRQALKCFKCNRCFSSEVALKYHTNKAHKINLYRTNYVHLNLTESPLHTSQPQISPTVQRISPVSDAPGDFSTITTGPDKNPIPVTMLNGNSKDVFVDASVNSIVGVLSTPVTMEPSNNLPRPYGTDRRLSDPTNVAISTILSQLFERTIASVPE
eukprot:XP_003728855.1 PREDICTED: uncharacterized protein LOC100892642 [Strongylocentrotus purpuratus]